MLKILY